MNHEAFLGPIGLPEVIMIGMVLLILLVVPLAIFFVAREMAKDRQRMGPRISDGYRRPQPPPLPEKRSGQPPRLDGRG